MSHPDEMLGEFGLAFDAVLALGDHERWRTREPPAPMSLKRIAEELSVAEYSLIGIETNPKLSDREAIERAAMVLLSWSQ